MVFFDPQHLQRPRYKHHVTARRLKVLVALCVIAFLGLVSRLYQLQVHDYQHYRRQADDNTQGVKPIAPKRGLILDRWGHLLAGNRPVTSLVIDLHHITDLAQTLQALAQPLSLTQDDLETLLKQSRVRRRERYLPIKLDLQPDLRAQLAVDFYHYPGLVTQVRSMRYYPHPQAFFPVIGYMGAINRQELADLDTLNYANTHMIGKMGVEKDFESVLHGQTGFEQLQLNANGRLVKHLGIQAPKAGENIRLTLDRELQLATYQALRRYRGAAVAIDPTNGDILALASSPSADGNALNHGHFQSTRQPGNPLFNRATQGQYPPASTIKPLLALQGLKQGLITPHTTIHDKGWFTLPRSRHRFHDWLHTGHGRVALHKAIVTSCDTYFYHLAMLLGITHIDEILGAFGVGQPLAKDMPYQKAGLLASPQNKLIRHHERWYPGDTIISGIGQGDMLVTPLQLASIAATLASRGRLYQPRLLLCHQQGTSCQKQPGVLINTIDAPQAAWHAVIHAMQGVIDYGTGFRFGHPSYTMAGKTGTAQIIRVIRDPTVVVPYHLRDHSLFMGFAPAHNPRIAVAVVLEHTPEAPAVTRRIMDAYFETMKQHA